MCFTAALYNFARNQNSNTVSALMVSSAIHLTHFSNDKNLLIHLLFPCKNEMFPVPANVRLCRLSIVYCYHLPLCPRKVN